MITKEPRQYSLLLTKIKRMAEVEYRLLLACNKDAVVVPELLEIITYKSDNPWFRTEEFRRLFIHYRTIGYPALRKKQIHEAKVRAKHNRAKRKRERPRRPYHRKTKQEDLKQ